MIMLEARIVMDLYIYISLEILQQVMVNCV